MNHDELKPNWLVEPTDNNELTQRIWPSDAHRDGDGEVVLGGVPVSDLTAQFGTPLYVYSQRTLSGHFQKLDRAMRGVEHLVWYCSQFFVMEPGDIIITGTPPGVGLGMKPPVFLKAGDVIGSVNGKAVTAPNELIKELADKEGEVTVGVTRRVVGPHQPGLHGPQHERQRHAHEPKAD